MARSKPEIAKRFKVSRSVVSDIATGRVHKDVDWPNGEPPTPKRAGGQHKTIPDYDPTDKRVLELEAEIVHLTDERNRERQKVKAGAKIAGLFKAITAEMEQRIKPFAPLPPAVRVPPQGPDCRALRHAPLGRPPRSGRAAGGSWRPGRLQLPDLVLPAPSGTSIRSSNGPRTPWPRSSTSRCSGCWPTATTPAAKSTRRASGPTTATSSRIAWPSASCTP